MASIVKSSIEYFADPTKGRPVANGSLYVGVINLDPEVPANQKQISAFQESGVTVPVSQPLSLSSGGVPIYSGSPVTVLVDGNYSLKIVDKHGAQVYYVPDNSAQIGALDYDHFDDGGHIFYGTFAALRASTRTPFENQIVKVLGHTTAANKDWEFKWDPTSTTTDDDGTVLKQTSITVGRWERLIPDLYNIDSGWWGAITGAINDAAIKAAIAYATSGKGQTIHIPESLIASTIVVDKANTTINSGGQSMTYDTTYAKIGSGDFGVYNVMFAATANNISFVNCTFKQGAYTGSNVFIWAALSTQGCLIFNNKFYDSKYDAGILGTAIQARTTATGVLILNNKFYNCKACTVTQGDKCLTQGNISYNDDTNGAHDAVYSINNGTGSAIVDNKVYKGALTPLSGSTIDIQVATDFIVSRNQIYGFAGGVAILVFDFGGAAKSDGGIISDNIISGGGYTATGIWNYIKSNFGTDIEIKNNILKDPPTIVTGSAGIVITPDDNRIIGNKILLGDVTVNEAIRVDPDAINNGGKLCIKDNEIFTAGVGVEFSAIGNNEYNPIELSGNSYDGTMTVAIRETTNAQNFPLSLHNENFISDTITIFVSTLKQYKMFGVGLAQNFPYKIVANGNSSLYAYSEPLSMASII